MTLTGPRAFAQTPHKTGQIGRGNAHPGPQESRQVLQLAQPPPLAQCTPPCPYPLIPKPHGVPTLDTCLPTFTNPPTPYRCMGMTMCPLEPHLQARGEQVPGTKSERTCLLSKVCGAMCRMNQFTDHKAAELLCRTLVGITCLYCLLLAFKSLASPCTEWFEQRNNKNIARMGKEGINLLKPAL